MISGSCLCGGVTYRATEVSGPYVYCHCSSCRKANGTAFAANVAVPAAGFILETGSGLLAAYESSPGKLRHFCSVCGSPIYTTVGNRPEMVRIRLGTLDSEFSEPPAAHIFVAENPAWHVIADDVPRFSGWPDRRALAVPGSRQDGSSDDREGRER